MSRHPPVIGLIIGLCSGMIVIGLRAMFEYSAVIQCAIPYDRGTLLTVTGLGFILVIASFALLVPLILCWLSCCVVVAAGPPSSRRAEIATKVRDSAFSLAIAGITFVAAYFLFSARAYYQVQRLGFQAAIKRAEPILHGIDEYQLKNRKLPESLAQLVPEFLPELPTTGLPCHPNYDYTTAQDNVLIGDAGFTMSFSQHPDVLTAQTCFYRPTKKYPASIEGYRVERLGDWAIFFQ